MMPVISHAFAGIINAKELSDIISIGITKLGCWRTEMEN